MLSPEHELQINVCTMVKSPLHPPSKTKEAMTQHSTRDMCMIEYNCKIHLGKWQTLLKDTVSFLIFDKLSMHIWVSYIGIIFSLHVLSMNAMNGETVRIR